jgi:hypothetical protein
MKTSTTMAIGFALVSASVLAVYGADTKSAHESESGSYTGCLAAGDSEKEFKLTHVNGGEKEYELDGGKDLKNHVGHKVEVHGKLMPAKDEKAESAHEHLEVASMKHIDAKCP